MANGSLSASPYCFTRVYSAFIIYIVLTKKGESVMEKEPQGMVDALNEHYGGDEITTNH